MPVQRLADAEAAARSASDTGAADTPQARLHLQLAREEIARAHSLMHDGDNQRADFVLMRAQSDAELALAETNETHARAAAQQTLDRVAAAKGELTNPTSVTTTTSSTITKPPASSTTTTTTTTEEKKP
jgi:hypothetical protein